MSGTAIDQWFTGRQRELNILAKAVRNLHKRPRLIKMPGEAGIGKTRLLTEFLALAAENSGTTVIGSTAAEDQHGPFDTLTSVLGTPAPGAPAAPHQSRAPLAELAGPGGLVLVVDDLHEATHGINVALEQLLRHPPLTNLLVVLAYRSRGIANRLLAALGTAQSHWDIEDLPLGALGSEAAEQLYPEHLCGQHQMTLHQHSGGNPRYLHLLMALCQGKSCRGESILRAGIELPHEVTAPILMDLDRLSGTARVVAQAAAVVGDAFDLELTTLVAELDRATVLVAIDELLAFDLVEAENVPGCFRFRHPVLRGVAYRSAPDGWRLGAHARAVEALRSRNQPAVRIAEHVERVGDDGPDSVAVLIAAGRAIDLSAPDTAASWYRTALRLLGDRPEHHEQRLELLTSLARGAILTGRLDDGREALDRRDELLKGGMDGSAGAAAAVECRAQLALYAGRYTEARAMLRLAIAHGDPAANVTRLRLALAATTVWDTGWEWSEDALLGAAGSGDHMLQVLALGVHAIASLAKGSSVVAHRSAGEAAQLIDRQPDDQLARRLDAVCYVGWAEIHLERYAQAIRHFTRGLALSRPYGQWQPMVPLLVGLGTAHLRRGHLESAQAQAEQAIRLAQNHGCEDLLAMALTLRAQIALAVGATLNSLADSRAASSAVTPDSPRWRQARLTQAAALLANGQPAECLEAVLDAGGGASLLDLPLWDHPRAYDLMSRAELVRDRPDEARVRAEQVRISAEALGLPGVIGLAAAALARVAVCPAEALAHALRAIDAGTTNDQPLEAGKGHLLASRALLALGEPARAEKHLDAAESTAVSSGAGDLLPAVRALRAEMSARVPAAPVPPEEQYMLSQREFEIANLVSQGRTNRQIARQLEVSHKTVETHLGRIFTKLSVSSRAEIANMVGRASVIARPRRTAAVR
ncbi:LuxR C-terminal-related transcriptional regulator [Streptomyces sp. NBC_01142]|uniref:LuxR C-terminal-related transcriptional regulator n=1 Tax=Streptomyces sp. NBC_01142 TaxID=2975865 RepID=UPI00225950A1|nr:LuxR family transcriptional regulator [Streptomyces sp. NBC_01142]MCX4820761.1 LuxR C-terminal-related transcriptional regulator [Streptomyces sp. NBC_01142]